MSKCIHEDEDNVNHVLAEKGAIESDQEENGEDAKEEHEFRSRPSKFNALLAAAFDQAEDGNSSDGSSPMIESDTSTDEEGEGEEDEENQGQREKAANEKAQQDQKEPSESNAINRNQRKKKRRTKKRPSRPGKAGDADLDELLREIERKEKKKKRPTNRHPSLVVDQQHSQEVEADSTESAKLDVLLAIEPSILLDKVETTDTARNPSSTRPPPPLSKLVQTRVNWPQPRQLGFHMILDSAELEGRVRWYRFWHKETYQRQQQLFWLHQRQMDFQNISVDILRHQNPYHLDSLLLMAHLWERQGDLEAATTCTERGIFACEFVAHSNFQLFSSTHRLNYAWRENRPFFLLVHRHLLTKLRKGRLRVALEFAKFLFAKEPDGDPLALLLLIDSLALRARCPNFLLDFYDHFSSSKRLDLMPNFRFSLPLALLSMGQSEEAEKFLEEALVRFPFVLSQILDHLQVQADASVDRNYYLNTLAGYRETESMLLLVRVFLHHSASLWREPAILNWLETATHRILPRLQTTRRAEMDEWTKRRKQLFVGLPENLARHCLLHGIPVPEALQKDANLHLTTVNDPTTFTDPCAPKSGLQAYLPEGFDEEEIDVGTEELTLQRHGGVLQQRRAHASMARTEILQQSAGGEQQQLRQSQSLVIAFLRSLLPQWIQDFLVTLAQRFRQFFTNNNAG